MNTEYASSGLPSEAELKILEPLKGKIPDSVFTEEFKPPTTKGDGNIRSNLRQALRLFKEAGWSVKNQKLINNKTGKQFEFELDQKAEPERITPFVDGVLLMAT